MQPSTNAALKVLTPTLAEGLRTFNEASRELQKLGVRLHRFDPAYNRLTISSEDGRRLVEERLVCGYHRHATAGSTRYWATFQGVEVAWSEEISYRDFSDPYDKTTH